MARQTSFRIWIRRSFRARKPFSLRLESGSASWSLTMGDRRLIDGSGERLDALTPEQVRQTLLFLSNDPDIFWSLSSLTDAVLYSMEAEEWIELNPRMDGELRVLLPRDADSIRRVESAMRSPDADEQTANMPERSSWTRRSALRDALHRGAQAGKAIPTRRSEESIDVVLRERTWEHEEQRARTPGIPEGYRIIEDTEEEVRALAAPWPRGLLDERPVFDPLLPRIPKTPPPRQASPDLRQATPPPAERPAVDAPESLLAPPASTALPPKAPPPPPAPILAPTEPPPQADAPAPARLDPEPQRPPERLLTEPVGRAPAILRALRRQAMRHETDMAVLQARITELERRSRP